LAFVILFFLAFIVFVAAGWRNKDEYIMPFSAANVLNKSTYIEESRK